jgi:PAS domain S-box-containing protein
MKKYEKTKFETRPANSIEVHSLKLDNLETFFAEDLRNSFDEIAKIIFHIFNHSFDGFCVTRGDGVMIAVNKAAAGYLNLSPKVLLNRNVKDLVAEGFYDYSTTLEVIKKRKKLTRIYKARNNKSILNTGIPIFDAQGNIEYIVQNERDITQIKKLEGQLQNEKAIKKELIKDVRQLSVRTSNNSEIISNSKKMRNILSLTSRCARIDLDSLLLLGETGVGKGVVTDFFHKMSNRSTNSLIRVNCAALPENLLEAELFGYEKGAFTGAGNHSKPGLFELAHGGTLFLDEVGELPLSIQAKLLHCLEERKIFRLGGTRFRQINCCVVAATNRDLRQMCNNKQFREDLYYRLNTVSIKIPPLRNRREDITPLAKHFLNQYNKKYKMQKNISPRGYGQLNKYNFPGNVRELSNIINNSMIMSDSQEFIDYIIMDHIVPPFSNDKIVNMDLVHHHQTLAQQMALNEKNIIMKALEQYSTVLETAKALGVSKATLMRKQKKYQLLKKDRA